MTLNPEKWKTAALIIALSLPLALGLGLTATAPRSNSADPGKQEPGLVEFDAPGAYPYPGFTFGTFPLDVNDSGTIVGSYTDVSVVPHGFLLSANGTFASFDAPGAGLGTGLDQGTFPYSINDAGVVAGQFQDDFFIFHAFIRYADGSFTTFDAPGAGTGLGQGTLAYNINREGDTAGVYYDDSYGVHGFLRLKDGTIETFDAPDASPGAFLGTNVCQETCLNNSGAVTGWYFDAVSSFHGFVRSRDGTIVEFDGPGAGTGPFLGTIGASINNEGAITGYILDSSGVVAGYVRRHDGGIFVEPQDPDAGTQNGTVPFSINQFGAIAGVYIDSINTLHGFLLPPLGGYLNFTAPDGGTGFARGTRTSTLNDEGETVGWYTDSGDVEHGFYWIPPSGHFLAGRQQEGSTAVALPKRTVGAMPRLPLPLPEAVRQSMELQSQMKKFPGIARLPIPEKIRELMLKQALARRLESPWPDQR